MTYSEIDRHLAAATLYGESDPENVDDAAKLCAVILNRRARSGWRGWRPGAGLADVCLAPAQFSCWNWLTLGADGPGDRAARARLAPLFTDLDRLEPRADAFSAGWPARLVALVAEVEAAQEAGECPANGADHYHASYIRAPSWARGRKPVAASAFSLGGAGLQGHLFYRLNGSPAPKASPLPRSKRVKGAIGAGGALGGGAVLDELSGGGAAGQVIDALRKRLDPPAPQPESPTVRTIPGATIDTGKAKLQCPSATVEIPACPPAPSPGVPLGAFAFVLLLLLAVIAFMLWTRRVDSRPPQAAFPWLEPPRRRLWPLRKEEA